MSDSDYDVLSYQKFVEYNSSHTHPSSETNDKSSVSFNSDPKKNRIIKKRQIRKEKLAENNLNSDQKVLNVQELRIQKQEKIKQNNRISAQKSREKAKQKLQDLQDYVNQLVNENQQLQQNLQNYVCPNCNLATIREDVQNLDFIEPELIKNDFQFTNDYDFNFDPDNNFLSIDNEEFKFQRQPNNSLFSPNKKKFMQFGFAFIAIFLFLGANIQDDQVTGIGVQFQHVNFLQKVDTIKDKYSQQFKGQQKCNWLTQKQSEILDCMQVQLSLVQTNDLLSQFEKIEYVRKPTSNSTALVAVKNEESSQTQLTHYTGSIQNLEQLEQESTKLFCPYSMKFDTGDRNLQLEFDQERHLQKVKIYLDHIDQYRINDDNIFEKDENLNYNHKQYELTCLISEIKQIKQPYVNQV